MSDNKLYGTENPEVIIDEFLAETGEEILEELPEESAFRVRIGYVVNGNLNLREQPSKDSKILKVIPIGTAVTVQEETDGWYRVDFLNAEGWVMSEFVKIEE